MELTRPGRIVCLPGEAFVIDHDDLPNHTHVSGLSVTMWALLVDYSAHYSCLIHKGSGARSQTPSLFLHPNSGSLRPRFSTRSNRDDGVQTCPGFAGLEQWIHIAYCLQGRSIEVFINGERVTEFHSNEPILCNSEPLRIGDNFFLNAKIKNVRFFPFKLNQREAVADMNTESLLRNEDEKSQDHVSDFEKLLLSENLSDITILIGPEETQFFCHKFILYAKCGYFQTMLEKDWIENQLDTVKLEQFDQDDFEAFLRMIYVDDVPQDFDVQSRVFHIAEYLDAESSLRKLMKFQLQSLSFENFSNVITLAHRIGDDYSLRRCIEFFREAKTELMHRDDIFDLDKELLKLLFRS